MITFKSIAALQKLDSEDPVCPVVKDCLDRLLDTFHPYDPDTHGYVILIEPGDTQIDLPELKGTMAALSWDGVTKRDGHYHAVYLTNNSWALEVVVHDADWLPTEIRDNLDAHAESWPPYMKTTPF